MHERNSDEILELVTRGVHVLVAYVERVVEDTARQKPSRFEA